MGLFSKLFGAEKNKSGVRKPIANFTPTDALMDEDRFWKIIDASKDKAAGNFAQQQVALAQELRSLTPDDIILFANRFFYFRGQAYTWDLWGAIYIIHGGCGDDSFIDFREWVIAQGKEFYYKTINDPETLVEVDTNKIENVEWEGLGYIPGQVFNELTRQELPLIIHERNEPMGNEWEDDSDDLKKMFPKLAAKYPNHLR